MTSKAKSILMSAPMICAALGHRKKQTRRIVRPVQHGRTLMCLADSEFYADQPHGYFSKDADAKASWGWENMIEGDPYTLADIEAWQLSPYGKVGAEVWVREAWAGAMSDDGPVLCYRADNHRRYLMHEPDMLEADGSMDYSKTTGVNFSQWAADLENSDKGWRPSIHMYRWASRLSLRITGLRIERLHAITEADAIAEGIEPVNGLMGPGWLNYCHEGAGTGYFAGNTAAVDSYASLWEKLNGPGSWAKNPWVWVITFDVVEQ